MKDRMQGMKDRMQGVDKRIPWQIPCISMSPSFRAQVASTARDLLPLIVYVGVREVAGMSVEVRLP
jgi:hypothetical protein